MTILTFKPLYWVEDVNRTAPFDGPEVVRVWIGMALEKRWAKVVECDDGQFTLVMKDMAGRHPTLAEAQEAAVGAYRREVDKVFEPDTAIVADREAEATLLGDVVWLLTDEDLRYIAESKDTGSCRYRIKDALLIALRRLPPPAEGAVT